MKHSKINNYMSTYIPYIHVVIVAFFRGESERFFGLDFTVLALALTAQGYLVYCGNRPNSRSTSLESSINTVEKKCDT